MPQEAQQKKAEQYNKLVRARDALATEVKRLRYLNYGPEDDVDNEEVEDVDDVGLEVEEDNEGVDIEVTVETARVLAPHTNEKYLEQLVKEVNRDAHYEPDIEQEWSDPAFILQQWEKANQSHVVHLRWQKLDIVALPELPLLPFASSLLVVDLFGNKLTSLPDVFSHLSKVQSIDLSDNAFSEFPSPLLALGSLKDLNLSRNKLSTLPSSIASMSSLERLDLMRNELEGTLPESCFDGMRTLKSLVLDCNYLNEKQPAIELLQSQNQEVDVSLYLSFTKRKRAAKPRGSTATKRARTKQPAKRGRKQANK